MALARLFFRGFSTEAMSLQKRMSQCFALRQFDEALRIGEELKSVAKAQHGENHPKYLQAIGGIAQTFLAAGQYDRAIEHAQEMHDKYLTQFGEEHKTTIQCKHVLGTYLMAKGQFDAALVQLHEALALWRKQQRLEILDLFETLLELGRCYFCKTDYEKSLLVLREAKKLIGDKYGYDNYLMGKILEQLSPAQAAAGDLQTAFESQRIAYEMHREWYGPEHSTTRQSQQRLEQLQALHPQLRSSR